MPNRKHALSNAGCAVEALTTFRRELAELASLTDGFDDNPFPASIDVHLSALEIYNEQVRDLLDASGDRQSLEIRMAVSHALRTLVVWLRASFLITLMV